MVKYYEVFYNWRDKRGTHEYKIVDLTDAQIELWKFIVRYDHYDTIWNIDEMTDNRDLTRIGAYKDDDFDEIVTEESLYDDAKRVFDELNSKERHLLDLLEAAR